MAMFVTIGTGEKEYVYQTHIGSEDSGFLRGLVAEFDGQFFEIQADGHELEHIKKTFVNLPYPQGKRVVRWYGEHAKLILGNW